MIAPRRLGRAGRIAGDTADAADTTPVMPLSAAVHEGTRTPAELLCEILDIRARVLREGAEIYERLIKKGRPACPEATDAAMSQRAECVMLNKGPHLVEGVQFLEDVLRRMDRHQAKKSPRLTVLHASQDDQGMKLAPACGRAQK